MPQLGLVRIQSNADMMAEEAQQLEKIRALEQPPQIDSLVGHLRRLWTEHRDHKRPVEERILASTRQINGIYDDKKLAEIREIGGSEIFMMLTAVKCRAAKAWIRDVLMPAGERPWSLRPTPVPTLPQDEEVMVQQRVMQDAYEFEAMTGMPVTEEMFEEVLDKARSAVRREIEAKARTRADRMADKIEDQLVEGGWHKDFDDFISDIVDFPAAIMKGPVVLPKRCLQWEEGFDPEVYEKLIPLARRIDPLNIYPAPGAEDFDSGDVFERHRLTRSELYDLIDVPGYEGDAIREVLRHYGEGGGSWLDFDLPDDKRADATKNNRAMSKDRLIDVLQFHGTIRGQLLEDWGLSVEDPDAEYDVEVWFCDRWAIKVQFNPDPMGRKPYYKACFEEVAGSFWGNGVPDLISDCQGMCNGAARAISNNMGLAAGPQIVVDADSAIPGDDLTNIFPFKIWQRKWNKNAGQAGVPVEFYQPQMIANALMQVFEFFSKLADEQSGIPPYSYGLSNTGGAGRTASGLSMLMNAASKGIKSVISNIDRGVLSPLIERFWTWNMLFNDDESIKGDMAVVARGALSLVQKEAVQMRRQEFLGATLNPVDMQIIGVDGRAAILRELVKGLDMPASEIVPDNEELIAQIQAQMGAPQGGPPQDGPPRLPGEQDPQNPGPPRAPRPQELDVAGSPIGRGPGSVMRGAL